MKHEKPKTEYYLLSSDIEELNERFGKLYRQITTQFENKDVTKNQIEAACEVLLNTYKFEVKELNALRETEYLKRKAAIDAKNNEQIPWRRGWWWRLLFRPLTNRAQDIIEERAELEAEELFSKEEKELEARRNDVYGTNKKLSGRKRKKALKKYLKYKRMLEGIEADTPKESLDVPAEPPAPPPRKPRKTEG